MQITQDKLFAYGSLQYPEIQRRIFGRQLTGIKNSLLGYDISTISIPDASINNQENTYLIISFTGNNTDKIDGLMYDVNQDDLFQADQYEGSSYRRIEVVLTSGQKAWVYAA